MKRRASLMLLLCLTLLLPAAAQSRRIEGGPASPLSSSPVYGAASGAQWIGTVVPTPAGWIAVWVDAVMQDPQIVDRRLLATRLNPDGTVRDTTGMRVSAKINSRYTAVPEGDGARLFWARPGSSGLALHTASVSDDGAVSAESIVGELPSDALETTLVAASSGNRTAVLFDRYLMILDGARLLRTIPLGGYGDPSSVAAAASHFVVTWVAASDILMRQTFDLDGAPAKPEGGIGVASGARAHTLATNGSNALLAWSNATGVRMSIVDPANDQLTEASVLASAAWVWPRAVWTGSSYLVTWSTFDGEAIVGVRVSAEGALLDTEPRQLSSGTSGIFAIAARGSQALVLSQTGGCGRYNCETDIYATLLDPVPATGRNLVSAAARAQTNPAVASDGGSFLALWREGSELFAAETTDRSRVASAPIPLGEAWGTGHRSPAMALAI